MHLGKRLLCAWAAVAAVWIGMASPAAAALNTPRWGHTTTLMSNGNIIVIGGATDAAGTPTTSVEIYISTDGLAGYMSAASMPVARASHTATMLPDGRILVVGGRSTAGGAPRSDAHIYTPETNTWSAAVTGMNAARMNHTATLLPNGNILIAGGQTDNAGTVTSLCNIFDSNGIGWLAAASLGLNRAGHTATLLHDGRVMAAGGFFANGTDFAVSTEFYDYQTNAWTPGPSLISKRAYHTATQLGNRKVLIAGGYNARNVEESLGYLDTTEIYDSVSNTITPGIAMTGRKMFHTALLSPTGVANIYGGFGNVTTSYADIDVPFELGSLLCIGAPVTEQQGTISAGFAGCTTALSIDLDDVLLTDVVNGRIINGEIQYSSGILTLQTGQVRFASPGTSASLDAVYVNAGTLAADADSTNVILPFNNPVNGTFNSIDVDVTLEDASLVDASIVTQINGGSPGSVAAGDTGSVDNGTVRITGIFGMPAITANANFLAGTARLTAMTISRGGTDEAVKKFDIDLTSGTDTDLSGCGPVQFDIITGYFMSCSLVFTNIAGTITNTSDTVITANSADVDLDNPSILASGIQMRMRYIPDRLDLSNQLFETDITTIVVSQMIFGDNGQFAPITNTWSLGVPAEPVFNHTALLLPNGDRPKIGGRNCPNLPSTNCTNWTFNPVTTQSHQAHIPLLGPDIQLDTSHGQMISERSKHASVVLSKGVVLIAGGVQGTEPIAESEIFDHADAAFTATGEMTTPRSVHTLTKMVNGRVLAVGGFTSASSTGATNTAEIFYPDTNIWLPTTPMASSRTFHTTILLPNGAIMTMGGVANGQFLNSAEIYYSTSRVWAPLPSMDTPRAQHTATLLHDGRVLVAGGANVLGVLGASNASGFRGAEIYDPVANSWSSATSDQVMNTARHSHTATLLRDGRVIFLGGNDGFGEIGKADIFSATGAFKTWTRTDPANTGPGRDMLIPRLNHAAQLMPNGKIFISGGFKANGTAIEINEGFDVDHSTFQVQGHLANGRGHHTSVSQDNEITIFGGNNGANDLSGSETVPIAVEGLVGGLDSKSNTGTSLRQPFVAIIDTGTVQRAVSLTFSGNNLIGLTEASGGMTGGSHHSQPRVYLERHDGGLSGFMVDLTTYVINTTLFGNADINAKWKKQASSITITIPGDQGLTPYGNYALRVANNAQFSEPRDIKIGPPVPDGFTSIPVGTLLGVASVTWSWSGVSSAHDGYSVYNATSDVWIATVPANAGTVTFIQQGLGPNNAALIKVAPYSLSGDGNVVVATIPINTVSADVVGLNGIAQSTHSILWTWAANSAATSYNVYNASTGLVIASTPTASFLEVNLATNTANSIQVQAVTDAGLGTLTSATTVFTLAAPPLPGNPPVTNVSSGSMILHWLANSNPANTEYVVNHANDLVVSTTIVSNINAVKFPLADISANALFTLNVSAINGDGIATSLVSLGSTATLAATPGTPEITGTSASSIEINWDTNGNPSTTTYQIVLSTDNFSTHFSTPVPFSDGFRDNIKLLSGLFTGLTYSFRISAINRFGQETAFVSTAAFTDNGGGAVGSLAVLVQKDKAVTAAGNLGNGRIIELSIPAGAFDKTTQLFISSESVLNCGSIDAAVTITAVPPAQPLIPFWMGLSYTSAEVPSANTNTISITRYDPIGGTCVPLLSDTNKIDQIVTAKVNHLSTFQLTNIAGRQDLSDVRIFPNPLYTRNAGYVTIDRLPADAFVRIFTIHGERVFNGSANNSGLLTWDARNESGRFVASGIYLVVLEGLGGTRTMKMAVLR